MATHVFKIDELATQIATHLLAISPKSTVALAMTCRATEVPALRTLWETRSSLKFLFIRILPTGAWCFKFLRQTNYDDDDPDAGYDDLCVLVSPLFSSSQHPAYLLITKTLTVVAAAAHQTGAD